MKAPIIRVIELKRRHRFRQVAAQLRGLLATMTALKITPEVEPFIKEGTLFWRYIEQRQLLQHQLENFRSMQSRSVRVRCTDCYMFIGESERVDMRVYNAKRKIYNGSMADWHRELAVWMAIQREQCELRSGGGQRDTAHKCVRYYNLWRKGK